MARKKIKKISKGTSEERAQGELENMTLRQLQRECALRGLSTRRVVKWDIPKLSSWFCEHFLDDRNPENLIKHDQVVEKIIRAHDARQGRETIPQLFHPTLRFSYIGEDGDSGKKPRVPRIKGFKKPVKKKERSAQGIFKGTKKALTFELAVGGMSKEDVIKKVIKEFPDAREKSISIWYNKAIKQCKNG